MIILIGGPPYYSTYLMLLMSWRMDDYN